MRILDTYLSKNVTESNIWMIGLTNNVCVYQWSDRRLRPSYLPSTRLYLRLSEGYVIKVRKFVQ